MKASTPCGAWPSPISARDVARGARRVADVAAAEDGAVCWLERRPEEGGRTVLVRRAPDGGTRSLTPDGFNVRSRVHEYGGAAFCLLPSGGTPPDAPASRPAAEAAAPSRAAVPLAHAFVNFDDQRVYLAAGAAARPLTPADGARYADLVLDAGRRRLLAVRERPTPGGEEAASLVAIPLPTVGVGGPGAPDDAAAGAGPEPPPPTELAAGADFFSSPRLSADGCQLAWLCWNHPDMPWDATELRLAELDNHGLPRTPRVVAGGDPDRYEAVQQPGFDGQGRLTFVSDRSGWWNLYRVGGKDVPPGDAADGGPSPRPAEQVRDGKPASFPVQPICPREAEFGVPPWLFGTSTYAHVPGGIVAACCERGVWRLLFLPEDAETGDSVPVPAPYTSIAWLRPVATPETGRAGAAPGERRASAVFLGAAPDRPPEIVRLQLDETGELDVLVRTGPPPDPRYLSTGRPISFASAGGRRAHAFFYPPKNEDARPPPGARPPLIVKSHGGPTSAAEHVHDPAVQFWTSRGFAVVDVNYGGSTGYGRAYRESLRGRWGVVDVEDCTAAAEALAAHGEADAGKLLIRGGSAGGYTTLAALAFKDVFAAGASHYGVADLAALARDTHKFESRYLDRLVGPWPERADLYRQRSPLEARDRFSCPVIFFQGAEDRIVPPNQAEAMVEALRAKGLRVDFHLFEGEQHGFRRTENIVGALEAELRFYGEVLGLASP